MCQVDQPTETTDQTVEANGSQNIHTNTKEQSESGRIGKAPERLIEGW